MDVSLYAEGLEIFCETLSPKSPQVLELACGPGNVTRFLLNCRHDLQITGTDLSENMIALAKANNPEGNFFVLDCRNLKEIKKKFDGVVCAFAFPYLNKSEVEQLIRDVSELLSEGGHFYLSTMTGNYEDSAYRTGSTGDVIFMHYYTPEYIKAELEKNSLMVTHQWLQPYESSSNPATDLIIISQKK